MSRTRTRTPLPPSPPRSPVPADAHLLDDELWDGLDVTADSPVPAHLVRPRWDGCRFTGVDLAGRDLARLDCQDTAFVHCDLSGARLDDATLRRVSFTDCRLTGAVLDRATLSDVVVEDSRTDLVRLRTAHVAHSRWERCRGDGADLHRLTARDSSFLHCDLSGATFTEARLTGVDLHGSTLARIRGPQALRGCAIGPDQVTTVGALLLGTLGIEITDEPRG